MNLVVDDFSDILELAKILKAVTAADAAVGVAILETQPIQKAFLDIHGIEKEGKDVHSLIELCKTKNIPFFITSNNPDSCFQLQERYNDLKFISKHEIVQYLKRGLNG